MTNTSLVNLVALIHGAYAIWIGVIGPFLLIDSHMRLVRLANQLLGGTSQPLSSSLVLGCLFLLFSGAVVAVSAILIQRRKLRMFSVVVGLFLLFLFPVGTLIGGFTLYSLFRQQTIQEYR